MNGISLQVGLFEFAKRTRLRSLRALTVVTLFVVSKITYVDDHNLHETKAEHEKDLDFPPECVVSLQLIQGWQRYYKDYRIKGHSYSSISPRCRIHIDAFAFVLRIPSPPGIRYGSALEYHDYDKGYEKGNVDTNHPIDNFSESLMWEDSQIES